MRDKFIEINILTLVLGEYKLSKKNSILRLQTVCGFVFFPLIVFRLLVSNV